MDSIAAHEVEISGARAAQLTAMKLVKLASRAGGWISLYRDPEDNRLWELSYPQSEMHGGGPPLLRVVSRIDATVAFGLGDDA